MKGPGDETTELQGEGLENTGVVELRRYRELDDSWERMPVSPPISRLKEKAWKCELLQGKVGLTALA
jgi:hypothetical protein